jgi:hypothetical protein
VFVDTLVVLTSHCTNNFVIQSRIVLVTGDDPTAQASVIPTIIAFIYGHTKQKALHPVRSAKLSCLGPRQYYGGGPRGNPRCRRFLTFCTVKLCLFICCTRTRMLTSHTIYLVLAHVFEPDSRWAVLILEGPPLGLQVLEGPPPDFPGARPGAGHFCDACQILAESLRASCASRGHPLLFCCQSLL